MAVSGPSHGRHLTPLSTPTAAQSTGYFDSSLMSKTWQGQHEKSMAPTLPALTIGMRSIDQQSHQQQQQQRSQPSLSTNNDSSQEYVVMDITMNVTCDTLALAFFHVVDDNNGKNCCDTSFTSKDAELLLKKLNGLSPPITPIKSRIATSAVCATPISTRVLQILSATTGQVLFLYPSDNLHRLAAGTELPPADVNDCDYRNLHDKTMAAAQDTLGKGHMACRHVCSRLRFVTVHGTRVAECVATRWGSLIFICTQLIGSEAEVVNRDDIGGGLGETRFVTPVGPFGVSFSTQSMLSSSSSTNSSANVTDHVDSLMPARTFNEDRSLPAQMSSTESNIITRCQSVPDFMAHRADNPAPRPSLSRLATTTAVNMWPTTSASSSASTGHSISVAGALPLIPQTPAHLATASLVHTNSLSSSYGSTIGVHPSYYQHGADSTDLMMWSEETRMSHGTPTTPTAPSFIQKPGSSHPMHTQSAPFSLALRQRESSQHNYGGMSSNSNHGSSNGGGSSSSGNSNTENKQCEQCGTMRSPEWRRGPSGHKTLCNACGLRYSRSLARAGKSAQNQRSTTTLGSQSSSGQRQLESSAMEIRSTMNHADNRPAPMILTSTPTFSPHYSAPSTPTSLSSTGNTATLPSSMAGRAGPMDIHSMSHSHPHSHSHHCPPIIATSIEHTAAVHLMNPGALQSGYATNSMITTPHHYATAYSADTIRNPSIMGVSSDMSKVDPRDIHHA
ncbi:hypothetical protein BDF22DRAFT_663219 [Syncephalis plumigaleata]|nr:hypothetical protein BDF22DRAFT_663219 [Syncephalis plumigaleata]